MRGVFVVISLFATLIPVGAQNASQGDADKRDIRWIGMGIDNPSYLSLPEAAVSQAFQAAAQGDRSAFYSHWKIDGAAKSKIDDLYRDWNTNSKEYVYIVGAEAVVGGKKPGADQLLAISVVPVTMKGINSLNQTNLSKLHVDVVCAQESSNHITLLSEIPDNSVKQALIQQSLPVLYHPRSSDSPLKDKFDQLSVENAKRNAVPHEFLASIKADSQLHESGVRITNWNSWADQFEAVIIDPPLSFEKAAPFNYDYRDAIAAFHSYLHASYIGDGKELLHHADDTGLAFLRRLHVSETEKRVYDLPTMSHVSILLTGTTLFEGKEYTLVLSRAENSKNPRNGYVALEMVIFVNQNGSFLMTQNLRDSHFGMVCETAGAAEGFWKYAEFEQVMEKSQFPKSFYEIPQ